MRIGYFIGAYGPQFLGNEIHEEIGCLLKEAGHEFEVLVPVHERPGGRERRQEVLNGITVHHLPLAGGMASKGLDCLSTQLFSYSPLLTLLRRYLAFFRQSERFDVLHVEGVYPLGAVATLASPQVRIPLVANIQGADIMSYPEVDYGYGRFPVPRLLTKWALARSAEIRANSPMTRRLAIALGANPENVQTVPRNITAGAFLDAGVDLADFRARQRPLLAERYGLEKSCWIATFSRLHPFKGVEYLLKAIPTICERIPDAGFLICGPSRSTPQFGDYRTYLERMARDLGVEESIVFTGEVDYKEAKSHLAAVDLLVVPSVVDALNKVVIEAAAVGTPSVVTRTSGISDYLRESVSGTVVEPRSPRALAEAIIRAVLDRDAWSEMSRRGPAFAQSFSSERVTTGLLALYQKAAKEGTKVLAA